MTYLNKVILYFYAVVIIIFIMLNCEACEKKIELIPKKGIMVLLCCDDIFFNPETGQYESVKTIIKKEDSELLDLVGPDLEALCDTTRGVQ